MLLFSLFFLLSIATCENEVTLIRRWKTTLEQFPMGYSSASFTIAKDIVYVVNGANVGNAVLKFDLEGNFLGEYPGWFNFPVDVVVGGAGQDQVLMTAIGAMGDDNLLRFGMVMYNSSGDFFHGFHEADTGLVRPYGLAALGEPQGTGEAVEVAVCDWDNNRTAILRVDWERGTIEETQELAVLPYPFDIAVTRERMIVASNVCCEEWHEAMKVVTIYARDGNGEPLTTIKELPTGEVIDQPSDVAASEDGRIFLLSDNGLAKTLMFDMEGVFLGEVEGLGNPKKVEFHAGLLYSLTCEDNQMLEMVECFINVFSYSW